MGDVSLRVSAYARNQRAQIVRGLEGRKRDRGRDGTPVAPGREHCLLERACEPSCYDMGAAEIGPGERRENGAVLLTAGEVDRAYQPAESAGGLGVCVPAGSPP